MSVGDSSGSGGGRMAAFDWKYSQVFGERFAGEQIQDVDLISAVEFDRRGDYLATGDHGGRVVLFETKDANLENSYSRKELESLDHATPVRPKYVYKTEFQSHEPEFDYLKSLEIEEKIHKLRWWTTLKTSSFLLSTNHRTIKLWKILDRKVKKIKEMNPPLQICPENSLLSENSFKNDDSASSSSNNLRIEWINKKPKHVSDKPPEGPSLDSEIKEGTSRCKRVYGHAHDYNINSISINSDRETFLSSDDLRINLWNLESNRQCFNIIDMKPNNMEDLIEVITSAEFHPVSCNLLAYSTSRGFVRLVDMRNSALCDHSAKTYQDHEAHISRSFFAEITASISDIKFANDGMHMLSRDYLNLKLWDLRVENSPISTYKIHEHLQSRLAELYNNDSIFDKFECCLSVDGRHFATGSYSNTFRVFSRHARSEEGITLEASKTPHRLQSVQSPQKASKLLSGFTRGNNWRGNDKSGSSSNGSRLDTGFKLTHLAWHPKADFIACASANSLYMYYA